MARRGEFQLIAELFAPLARREPGALGLTDDAAVLTPPAGHQLVATVDAVVAGVHFFPDDPPELIARKLIRVNLSDLAGMGARPLGLLLACAFPQDVDDSWLERFASGLAADVETYDVAVIGGDTVGTPGPATFSLTALGSVPTGQAILRSGAGVGDVIAVTGSIGDGALGLLVAQGELASLDAVDRAALLDRYRVPQPRLRAGQALRPLVSGGMDISDGLLQDLGHLCRASGVGARVEASRVPLSGAAAAAVAGDSGLMRTVMCGGDDYELLVTLSPESVAEAVDACRQAGVELTVIGVCTEACGDVETVAADGRVLDWKSRGFSHF